MTEEKAEVMLDKFVEEKSAKAAKDIPNLYKLNPTTIKNIVSSYYRGGLSDSPRTIELINAERYDEAADEFLRNAEYSNPKTLKSVKERMEEVADALRSQERLNN